MDSDFLFKFPTQQQLQGELIIQIVNATLKKYLQELANNENIDLNIDPKLFSYLLKGTKNKQQCQLIQVLNKIQVLLYPTSSYQEAFCTNKIFQNPEYNYLLSQNLQTKTVSTTILSQIPFDLFPPLDNISIEKNQLIIVILNEKNIQLETLQKNLNNFFSNNKNYGLIRITNNGFSLKKSEYLLIKDTLQQYADKENNAWIREDNQNQKINEILIILTIFIERDQMKQGNEILDRVENHLKSYIFPLKTLNSQIFQNQTHKLEVRFKEQLNELQKQTYIQFLNKIFTSQNYVIKTIVDNNEIVEIYFKGQNKEQLKQEASRLISEFVFENIDIYNTLLQQWPQDNDFIQSFNSLLEQNILLPSNSISYLNYKNEILTFFIISKNKEDLEEVKNKLNNFIDSFIVTQFDNQKVQQIFGKINNQEFTQRNGALLINNKLVGSAFFVTKIKNLKNHQIKDPSSINQLEEAVFQEQNKDKYMSIKKYILQNKDNFNYQIGFSDNTQSFYQRYFKQQDAYEFRQTIKDFQLYRIQLAKGAYKSLKNSQFLQGLEKEKGILLKKEKNQQKKGLQIKFRQNQKEIHVEVGNKFNLECDVIVVIKKNLESFMNYNNVNDMYFQFIKDNNLGSIIELNLNQLKADQYFFHKLNDKKIVLFLVNQYLYLENGEINGQCLGMIDKNIKRIFEISTELNLTSISLTVFGCGPCLNAYHETAGIIFQSILTEILSSNSAKKIVLIEPYDNRFRILKEVIEKQLFPEFFKGNWFSWQLKNNSLLSNIDNYIDQCYQTYQLNNEKSVFEVEHSYLEKQFTHILDLKQNIITNVKTKKVQNITKEFLNNSYQFYLDHEIVDKRFNDFLNLCLINDDTQIQINLSKVLIEFQQQKILLKVQNTSDQNCVKVNLNKKWRNWEPIKFEKKFELMDFDQDGIRELCFYSNEKNLKHQIQTEIEEFLLNNSINEIIQVDNLNQSQISFLRSRINQAAYKTVSNCEGNKIQLTSSKELLSEFKSKFSLPNYSSDKPNVQRSLLQQESNEYQQISKQISQKKIHQISQITNFILQKKYNKAKEDLISQLQNHQTYLWLCLQKQSPEDICGEKSQGIQPMKYFWGEGAYFRWTLSTENQYQDDDQNFLALYCEVCVDNWEVLQPSDSKISNIDGCYCNVQQNIFCLKGKHIELAYPKYEIRLSKEF